MKLYYLDASAWVKRYLEEPGSDWIKKWMNQGPHVAVAPLGFVEVLCTLGRKQRKADISAGVFERCAERLEEDMLSFIHVQFDDTVVGHAHRLARTYSMSGSDTIHLASAIALRDTMVDLEDSITFVACDGELKRAAYGSRFPVLDPEMEDRDKRRSQSQKQ